MGRFDCKECRLVVNRIEIKGQRNQKCILHAISEELVPDTFYRLVIEQPIPEEAKALPLFIKVHEGSMFAPTVRVSENEGCESDCENMEMFDEIEECGERRRSKMIPVDKFGLGQVAFGIDLVACRCCKNDLPSKCNRVFLTNGGEFTLVRRRHIDED